MILRKGGEVMKKFLLKKYVQGKTALDSFKENENGEVNIIAIILIIIVVIALVAVFRKQIEELITKLFTRINDDVDNM